MPLQIDHMSVWYNIAVYGFVKYIKMINDEALERDGREVLRMGLVEAGIRVGRIKKSVPFAERPDLVLDVELPSGERKRVFVEFKSNARRGPLDDAIRRLRNNIEREGASEDVPLLFSWHFGRPMRDRLRSQGIWFADMSGNRFFRAPGLLVDREVAQKAPEARESASSAFADRSSLVLRYLLPRPSRKVGIRELAGMLQLSPAAVSRVTRKLQELGYLEKHLGELRLLDREGLLEEWVSFYRSRFRGQKQDRLYVHAKSAESLIDRLGASRFASVKSWALSLHAGAFLVAPHVQFREVHLYVSPSAKSFRALLIRSLGAQKAEAEANLVLIDPYYKTSFLFDARVIRGLRVVSDLQLYLDLMCFPQRGKEQAEVILDRRLRPSWSQK